MDPLIAPTAQSVPFVFGKVATNADFTNREDETERLVNNFRALINTILISPRRWGKSSLVHKAADIALEQDPRLRIARLDLFNVRDEAHFYSLISTAVLKATASRWDEIREMAKAFLGRVVPRLVFSNEPGTDFSLELDWENIRENIDEIIDLPQRIAQEKGVRVIVCLDEFQNIANFSDPVYLQRRLRSHWQLQPDVAYCLYGSKRHMLLDVFTNPSMPFYKFGDIMLLEKIAAPKLEQFVVSRFNDTGKSISPEVAAEIVRLTDCHPYYTQQLAQQVWLRTAAATTATLPIVAEAHDGLIRQMSLLFSTLTDTLTTQQLAMLKAMLAGETSLSSTATMKRYGISSATALYRAKKALVEKEVLDDLGGSQRLLDPLYSHWLRHTYFQL